MTNNKDLGHLVSDVIREASKHTNLKILPWLTDRGVVNNEYELNKIRKGESDNQDDYLCVLKWALALIPERRRHIFHSRFFWIMAFESKPLAKR